MATNKGIPVINNFDLYAQKPLDSRVVIENEQELGELVNKGAIYDGMIFYRKDAQKFFQAQYLESGLTFTEFGGASGENVIVIKGTMNESEEGLPTYTITLTEEQFNKIYDTDLPVVLSLEPNKGVLSLTIEKSLNNNVKEITIGLTQSSYSVVAGFSATETSKPTFTLNSLVQTLQITYLILFGLVYDDQKNNLYLNETNINETNPYSVNGYLNPDIEGVDTTKYFIPRLYNGTITWVEQENYYNHFIYLALETTTKGTATIRINFTNKSSETINTLGKLKDALGQTFTLGGNGSIVNGSTYGTTYMLNQTSITGVVNGAQQVFNFADGTLTITDSVKQA